MFPVRYVVFQQEISSTGTPHYQGYVEFTSGVRLSTVCGAVPGIHVERRKGTAKQASDYCMKSDTQVDGPWSHGKMSKQGQREDLLSVKDMIDDGATQREVADAQFGTWCRNNKAFSLYRTIIKQDAPAKFELSDFNVPALDLSKPILVYGPSGYGKTEFADAHFGSALLTVRHIDDLKRYNANRHKGICFHDMSFSHWPFTTLCALLEFDKETSLHARYTNVTKPANVPMIFTFNHDNPFYDVEKLHPQQQAAINRRINKYPVTRPLFNGLHEGVNETGSPRVSSIRDRPIDYVFGTGAPSSIPVSFARTGGPDTGAPRSQADLPSEGGLFTPPSPSYFGGARTQTYIEENAHQYPE